MGKYLKLPCRLELVGEGHGERAAWDLAYHLTSYSSSRELPGGSILRGRAVDRGQSSYCSTFRPKNEHSILALYSIPALFELGLKRAARYQPASQLFSGRRFTVQYSTVQYKLASSTFIRTGLQPIERASYIHLQ